MNVRIGNEIYACGSPSELGIFTAVFLTAMSMSADAQKEQKAKADFLEKITKQIKSVEIEKIKKEGDSNKSE